jgi:hypothetical protein
MRHRAHCRAANCRNANHFETPESYVIAQRYDQVETRRIVHCESTLHGTRQQNEPV